MLRAQAAGSRWGQTLLALLSRGEIPSVTGGNPERQERKIVLSQLLPEHLVTWLCPPGTAVVLTVRSSAQGKADFRPNVGLDPSIGQLMAL